VPTEILPLVLKFLPLVILLLVLINCFFTVQQQTEAVVTKFGRFNRIAKPGLNFKLPFIEAVEEHMSLRVQELAVELTTKTKDNVVVKATLSVQFKVKEGMTRQAFYQLDEPDEQIKSYVNDAVLSQIPTMDLDDAYANKAGIQSAVKDALASAMDEYGWEIKQVLITNIDPDEAVKKAMNEINAAQRERVAAEQRAEANRIIIVGNAKAEAESKKLQGEGIANMRRAIAEGMKQQVEMLRESTGLDADHVLTMMMMTQHYDTMGHIGAQNKSTLLLMPSNPAGATNLFEEMRNALATANLVSRTASDGGENAAK
jgi:regulator of protease activity HflC (stomatin/prohibitin superfamily)